MTQPIDRAGIFRGRITEYGLREFDSGALGISVKALIEEAWVDDQWENWREYEYEASGTLFVIKKDTGEPNSGQVESLVRYTGWDGSLVSINNGSWQPLPCQFSVNEETYKNQTQFRISFLNDYNRTPGAMSNVNEEKVKALEARFGAPLRAIAGNAKRNSQPTPENKMPVPKKEPVGSAVSDGDIPF